MNLSIRVKHLKTLCKQGGSEIEELKWHSDDKFVSLPIQRFTDEDRVLLHAILQAAKDPLNPTKPEAGTISLIRKLNTYEKLRANVAGTRVTSLEALVEAIRAYMQPTPHKWLFSQQPDGETVPYFVVSAQFVPPNERTEDCAHTIVKLAAMCRRERDDESLRFEMQHMGEPVGAILADKGYYRETPEMVVEYEESCARYQQISGLTGQQYLATGKGIEREGHYSHSVCEMEVDGEPTRVVMDDLEENDTSSSRRNSREESGSSATSKFWRIGQRKSDLEEDDAEHEDGYVVLPLHPYVKVFNLRKHTFLSIHVNNLTEYVYDQTMVEKLILPANDKELLGMLVQGADEQMEDIVKGKTGGIIVIATGPPGTGKTLTAETFSELVKRPLYCVQCSQLGTSETKLESALDTVLRRSVRWQAILLIDEADVYVHERGSDIQQNAIVGVWLRILEHYRGIMFLTSNRSTIIDDAIMSRATAWIRYDRPTKELLRHIWRVLSTQYQVALTPEMIESLVTGKLGHITGRTVKNLLKLTRLMSRRSSQQATVAMVEYVSRYLDISTEEPTETPALPFPVPMTTAGFKKLQSAMRLPGYEDAAEGNSE